MIHSLLKYLTFPSSTALWSKPTILPPTCHIHTWRPRRPATTSLPSWTASKTAAFSVTATHPMAHTAHSTAEWPTWKRPACRLQARIPNGTPATSSHQRSTSTRSERPDTMLLYRPTRSDHALHTSCGPHHRTSISEPHPRNVRYHRRHPGLHCHQRRVRRA